jgi:hypothetical protein
MAMGMPYDVAGARVGEARTCAKVSAHHLDSLVEQHNARGRLAQW